LVKERQGRGCAKATSEKTSGVEARKEKVNITPLEATGRFTGDPFSSKRKRLLVRERKEARRGGCQRA